MWNGGKMGLVHIYTGDGKGKTTAAVGLATRFLGQGGCVVLVQFLKGSDSGEIAFFENKENIKILRLNKDYGFTNTMSDEVKAEVKKEHRKMLNEALAAVTSDFAGRDCMLILDECAGAISTKLLEEKSIVKLVDLARDHFEFVLTGRDFSESVLEHADYISEIKCVKHPMDQGVVARKGIEF
jgi:cob(I)alamin adenosyltransferase